MDSDSDNDKELTALPPSSSGGRSLPLAARSYVDVSLNVPVDKAFTYSVDSPSKIPPCVGSRVEVMLAGRRTTGIITAVHEKLPASCAPFKDKIRHIRRVIDSEPLLTQELLDLARWMASYYICAYGQVLCAMVPTGRREPSGGGHQAGDAVSGGDDIIASGDETSRQKSKVCLSAEQEEAVEGIVGDGANTGGQDNNGRNNNGRNSKGQDIKRQDNHGRALAYHYLYGPTGSGKTEVFLSAAERVLKTGKGVIYLVPEIGLTPQVARAAKEHFGDKAAVLHSALTSSERLMQWRRIIRREARIVIGARSAVFAPVPDLGLIIIDEEHDGSYKSGNTPRYHARQVAMRRAQENGIPLVMGSATPSVECWYAIENGTFACHHLTKRLAGGVMPAIQCVDLTRQAMQTSCFSRILVEEVRKTLAAKRQVILFLNRRGFTHYFRCMECGFELTCPNCSVPMTYHKAENRLRCHYCGHVAVPLEVCPKCGSLDVGYSGFGTEAVEAETRALFPNARIERVDADNVTRKHTLEDALSHFRRGECDILLGTQMVSKGLNFPRLSLVGVMLADTALHFPDFRAAERTFSLVTQVAGRAGRYFPDGRVIVQTYSANNPAIHYAIQQDSSGFYQWEINQRRMTAFPPFSRLVRIVFRSCDEKATCETSEEAAETLHKILDAAKGSVLGPAQCPLYKIARNYRRQLILSGKSISPLQTAARKMLEHIHKRGEVFVEIDVDPVSML